jgi:putative transposase
MPVKNLEGHRRKSIRLKGYDYSKKGSYFVTLNILDRVCVLGEHVESEVELSDFGRIADEQWKSIPAHFQTVTLDEFVIMPDHLHGIIVVENSCRGEVTSP